MLLSKPTTILLLGTDHAAARHARSARRSDSIMLVRTDPTHTRLAYLSIPRDLRVTSPASARARSTPRSRSAARTRDPHGARVHRPPDQPRGGRRLRQLPSARSTRSAGSRSTSRRRSSRTSSTARTRPQALPAWQGWRFGRGGQHMDGRRALIYSRIRENQLDPVRERHHPRRAPAAGPPGDHREADAAVGTFVRLPFIGDDLLNPLTTDLTAGSWSSSAG